MNGFRQNAFTVKFANAAKALGVTPGKIVSLKLRGNVSSDGEYRELIRSLEQEFGFQCSPVAGDLQGRGNLLTKKKSSVILVEHETGLEILYVAGSIASLIALIPLILQGWNVLRQFTSPRNPFNQIEVRRLDGAGNLVEHPAQLFHGHGLADASSLALTTATLLEEELREASGQIELLLPRIAALEERLAQVEGTLKSARPTKRAGRR